VEHMAPASAMKQSSSRNLNNTEIEKPHSNDVLCGRG
jgi:hypothetical protein